MKKRNDLIIIYYECNSCHHETTVPRRIGRKRERGHIKDMWCPYCNAESKFIEKGQY